MSVRSTIAAWMLCAAVSTITGSTAVAQGIDPLPIAGRRLVQNYTEAVDPSFTRLAAPWSLGDVPPALPCRLLAHAHLRPLLDELWSRSVTFRLQCRRLAGAHALVLLQGASSDETVWDAESRIGVLGDGRVMARVRVRLDARASRSSRTSWSTCSNASTACNWRWTPCGAGPARRSPAAPTRRDAPRTRAGKWRRKCDRIPTRSEAVAQ